MPFMNEPEQRILPPISTFAPPAGMLSRAGIGASATTLPPVSMIAPATMLIPLSSPTASRAMGSPPSASVFAPLSPPIVGYSHSAGRAMPMYPKNMSEPPFSTSLPAIAPGNHGGHSHQQHQYRPEPEQRQFTPSTPGSSIARPIPHHPYAQYIDRGRGDSEDPAGELLAEKRRRNAGASARFRDRRKQRERETQDRCQFLERRIQELESCDSYKRIVELERRAEESEAEKRAAVARLQTLEKEVQWLRAMLTERGSSESQQQQQQQQQQQHHHSMHQQHRQPATDLCHTPPASESDSDVNRRRDWSVGSHPSSPELKPACGSVASASPRYLSPPAS